MKRSLLLGAALVAANAVWAQDAERPNVLVIFGDDIGQTNISAYGFGVVGYETPNIDRIAAEGLQFIDYYAENTARPAGRPSLPASHPSAPG